MAYLINKKEIERRAQKYYNKRVYQNYLISLDLIIDHIFNRSMQLSEGKSADSSGLVYCATCVETHMGSPERCPHIKKTVRNRLIDSIIDLSRLFDRCSAEILDIPITKKITKKELKTKIEKYLKKSELIHRRLKQL